MGIKESAKGRWPSIYRALGIAVGNGTHVGCPICGPGRNKHRFRMTDRSGVGDWICTQCGAGDGFSLLMKCLNVDFKGAIEAVESVIGKCSKEPINGTQKYNAKRLRKMYADSKPLTGDCLGSMYLRNRGLSVFPQTLRYIEKCWEPSTNKEMPAILATFSAPDSEALTLHRIYLKHGGYKADIENCKLTMTPKKEMAGGAVRLFQTTDHIAVCEGIETAIAVHELFGVQTWATLSSSLMESFVPPNGAGNILIFADNDLKFGGQKAAYTLAHKLAIKGYAVSVEAPEKVGDDFLDVLVAKGDGREKLS